MKKRTVSIVLVLILLCVSAAFAQRQTGAIRGQIIDANKDALPGVTVTVSGPAMMGTQTFVSGAEGTFRFPELPPGIYSVTAELQGFEKGLAKGLAVNVGRTTEVVIPLRVSAIHEEISVTASAPVIDTQSTKTSMNVTSEMLETIPHGKDLYNFQNLAPGAIGVDADNRTSSILGSTVRDQSYALDGVPMTDPGKSYAMTNMNFDVFEEIELETVGHPAEVGQTQGAYINVVTKSGGNNFSGGVNTYFTNGSLARELFSRSEVNALGVNPPQKYTDYRDYSVTLGGPIRQDSIWFFTNLRGLNWDQQNPASPELRMLALGFPSSNPDTQHYNFTHEEKLAFGKVSWQASPSIHYMGMYHFNKIFEPIKGGSNSTARSNTEAWDNERDDTTTHQVSMTVGQNLALEFRGNYVKRFFPIRSNSQNEYSYVDYSGINWGASQFNDIYTNIKKLGTGSATYYLDRFLGATHEIKSGLDFENGETHRDVYRGNPYYSYWRNYQTRDPYYNRAYEGRLRVRVNPAESGTSDIKDFVNRKSAYLQDSINFKRLTVNAGVRYDASYQFEPQQSRPDLRYNARPDLLNPSITNNNAMIEWICSDYASKGMTCPWNALTTPWRKIVEFNTWSPRIGASFDLFGDGRTAIKASAGKYYEPIWANHFNAGNIFRATSVTYTWTDTNKNGFMDLPPVDKYVADSYLAQDPSVSYYGNLKAPYTQEYTVKVENEPFTGFRVGLEYVNKKNRNIVEDMDSLNGYDPAAKDDKGLIWLPLQFTDPGADGTFGTSDDKVMTVYGLRADRPAPVMKGGNPADARRDYHAYVFTADKRMSKNWMLSGSVVYSSFKGNESASFDTTQGNNGNFDTPNTLVNGYGPLGYDRPWQFKLMTTYKAPWDITITPYFTYLSGSPRDARTIRVYFPKNYMGFGVRSTSYTVNADPAGEMGRNPAFRNLDIRLEKGFRPSAFGRMAVFMDMYNVLGRSSVTYNTNPSGTLRLDTSPDKTQSAYSLGPNYGTASSVSGVRSIRLGAKFSF